MLKRLLSPASRFLQRRLPDGPALRLLYYRRLGRPLNLNNPTTFTEKIQWLKLYDRRPIQHQLVDKYAVRQFVAEKIGNQFLCKLYGIWDRPEDIPIDSLPNQFALKIVSGTHCNVFCRDKAIFDWEEAKAKLRHWQTVDYYKPLREWVYKGVKPRIIAEEFLDDGTGQSPADYKFYCFDGEPKFVEVAIGRHERRDLNRNMTITLLGVDWQPMPFSYPGYPPSSEPIPQPTNFAEMVRCVRTLSQGYPFLRVDLYSICGRTVFSELTFYPGAGFAPFQPIEWDEKVGQMLRLPARAKTS
jgi:hypothetical protein